MPRKPLFREVQAFPLWVRLPLAILAIWWLASALNLVPAPPEYDWLNWPRTIGGAILGAVVAALVIFLRLVVEVRPSRIKIRFFPFIPRTIDLDKVRQARVRTYRPIRDFGGWGLRLGLFGRGVAYNMKGKRGVQLTTLSGSLIIVGSQRSEELAAAIAKAGGPATAD